jgi:predicted RNase H-like HicB family nuclease
MKYLVIIEPTATNYAAYSPDVPGCVATGATVEEAETEMRDAIAFHLDGLRIEGYPVPEPQSRSVYVEVAATA